jgi:hypothetical protein
VVVVVGAKRPTSQAEQVNERREETVAAELVCHFSMFRLACCPQPFL